MHVSRVYPTFQLGMYIPDINLPVKIIREWCNRKRKSVFKSLSKFSCLEISYQLGFLQELKAVRCLSSNTFSEYKHIVFIFQDFQKVLKCI